MQLLLSVSATQGTGEVTSLPPGVVDPRPAGLFALREGIGEDAEGRTRLSH